MADLAFLSDCVGTTRRLRLPAPFLAKVEATASTCGGVREGPALEARAG